MLRIDDCDTSLCDGLTRREWLRIGGLGLGGLTLPHLLAARAGATGTERQRRDSPTGRAKSCIVMCFLGGPPQHETWDPKPNAVAEVRGDLRPIQTNVPGILVGELMPRSARHLDKIAVLRAMVTNDNSHSSSGYYMTTGVPHLPIGVENAKPGRPNDWPCLGSLVKRVTPATGGLPASITLPEQSANDGNLTWPGQDAGFLGRATDPWLINCDPAAPVFQIDGLALPPNVPVSRFEGRATLLAQMNQRLDGALRSGTLGNFNTQQQQALDLIAGARARRAFNLHEEGPALRDRYGRTKFGQSVLLARRLVEAGVSLVRVNWSRVPRALNNGHWDTHSQNTNGLKQLMPIMDAAYSTLLDDLATRGLLDETLVVWMAEFGRTPRLNGSAGRDHWGRVFSVALAGGGIRGGVVHGASDNIAGFPRDGRVMPQDMLATIFHCLGIDPDTEYQDAQGRPIPLVRGDVIRQIVA
ncbi:MAG: DUF1501 domain-containing protein [Planctomycetes bacterium]|nr:DUF1501 domain-containing protein [Planctomycetota bacterium]